MRWKFALLLSLLGCLVGPLPGLGNNLTTALKMSFADTIEQELREEVNSLERDPDPGMIRVSHPMLDLETGLASADSIFSNQEDNLLGFSPTPDVGLFAGYRFPQKDVFKRDITADVEFDGPYVGAVIRY